jgi:hypothetical protein
MRIRKYSNTIKTTKIQGITTYLLVITVGPGPSKFSKGNTWTNRIELKNKSLFFFLPTNVLH